jgi:hypothetical protein
VFAEPRVEFGKHSRVQLPIVVDKVSAEFVGPYVGWLIECSVLGG